jgi:CDP-glycerol glycerophosphotransferase
MCSCGMACRSRRSACATWRRGRALGPHFARVLATCGPYARLLGTAAAGEAEWRRWFAFERYAPIGYPRNDVLYREPTAADLAGCDRDTYDRARPRWRAASA